MYQRTVNERKSFNFFDRDRVGRVTATGFERGLERLNLGTTRDEAALILEQVRASAGDAVRRCRLNTSG